MQKNFFVFIFFIGLTQVSFLLHPSIADTDIMRVQTIHSENRTVAQYIFDHYEANASSYVTKLPITNEVKKAYFDTKFLLNTLNNQCKRPQIFFDKNVPIAYQQMVTQAAVRYNFFLPLSVFMDSSPKRYHNMSIAVLHEKLKKINNLSDFNKNLIEAIQKKETPMTLLIGDKVFEPAYAVGHEFVHLSEFDTLLSNMLINISSSSIQSLKDNEYWIAFKKFQENRADVIAFLKNKELIQPAIKFFNFGKIHFPASGKTHPSWHDRILCAQNIQNLLNAEEFYTEAKNAMCMTISSE